MKNSIPIENQYKRTPLFEKENVNFLIHVLKRFNTVPKLNNINIITSEKEPKIFKIIPNQAIVIGSLYLRKPVLALVYLRYAIEWQLWYKALNDKENDTVLCDIAAFEVARIFYKLLPKEDKEKLESLDYVLINLIKNDTFSSPEALLENEELQAFHGLENTDKLFKPSWEPIIENLAKPTEYLLMSGGDLRLNIDEIDLLNKYGCRPFPRPEAFTFASSTATSVSNFAFDKAAKVRSILIKDSLKNGFKDTTIAYAESLKNNLKNIFELNDECQIIFSPSGTDSSLQVAAITQIITEKDITHILVASDETGSGVAGALKGCHFENTTALNYQVKKGEKMDGFRDVNVIKIPFRDECGILKSADQLDEEVLNAITETNKLGHQIVLHVMDHSKLGYQSPSEDMMQKLNTLNDIPLQIVVDAAQLRLDPSDIQNYLSAGYIVSITGSKYFTGPPYAGALIIPETICESIESSKVKLPVSLNQYYNRSDWPTTWFCSKDLSDGFNYGSYMRWNAAIVEMDRYYKTPILYRNLGIEMFCNFIEDSIKDVSFLEPLYSDLTKTDASNKSYDFGIRSIRTIFPFFIIKDNQALTVDKVKKLYVLLNSDISDLFEGSPLEIVRLAAQKCHIGQAVNVKYGNDLPSAILRISLGARVISESWVNRDISIYFRNIEAQMNQVIVIIRKIELILNTPDLLD
ncbi:pyridoxal dependent decarboxylase [Formosa agariphila KMM 3901]|uniref:Pyridoxal dependent decarboxylase n=1 Tax=Formosa agariphila (strain DSM 15362 / KCTC 12365 / LMG 23005 / KMM 3901 / M-2Alg 35-1) TaxID=1347342 RepID=T2KJM3_FORAG|nr:hypothetical protein [Formosa agariphila]CDF79092.1 pyridoxal dependent decarboxylase [Formosa agariphila KMM 3901]